MAKSIRTRALFVPPNHITEDVASGNMEITNLIFESTEDKNIWIHETTSKIGDWRNISRSVYLRWAITINAMFISANHYDALADDKRVQTKTMRVLHGDPVSAPLANWTGPEAAEHYRSSVKLIAAYGVSDLVGAIEEIIFECFEIFLRHDPSKFTSGRENKEFRRAYNRRNEVGSSWPEVWKERYDSWRRSRAYDPLHRVLSDYWREAKLQTPSYYKHTNVDNWAETLKMFSELRNLIVHGAAIVSDELEACCQILARMTFSFKAGEPLVVDIHHLQSIECFIDQYLNALNVALLELGIGHPMKI